MTNIFWGGGQISGESPTLKLETFHEEKDSVQYLESWMIEFDFVKLFPVSICCFPIEAKPEVEYNTHHLRLPKMMMIIYEISV